jgi:hypothetical protein
MKHIIIALILTFSVITNVNAEERYFTIDMKQNATLYFYGKRCLIDRFSGAHAELVLESGRVMIACWIPNESTKNIMVFYTDGDYYQYSMVDVKFPN